MLSGFSSSVGYLTQGRRNSMNKSLNILENLFA